MSTSSGRFVICYNGEAFNYRELAAELKLENLRSRSDTEVVLRAFELVGVDLFHRLNGIFALAVYDRQEQRVWLARDRLGVKPLYYRLNSEGLVFGSEIKAIAAVGDQRRVCDVASIHEWLYYGNTLGGRTLHQDIVQLLPGHYLELDLTTFQSTVKSYWLLEREAEGGRVLRASPSELIADTRRLLEEAVRRQLISDVPVGVFLSGGIDSTAITAFACRHYAGRLATYSAGFDGQEAVDERPKAKRLAAQFGTDHHELFITGHDVASLVEKMVHHHDQPFADAANIPLYIMAAQISGTTKVVLQGDGGDELFGGYRRYATLAWRSWMRPAARLLAPVHRLAPRSARQYRIQRYLEAFAAPDIGTTMALLLTLESARSRPARMFGPGLRAIIERSDPFRRYRECQQAVTGHDIGNQMSLVDMMIELPDIFLEKVDRATMAASLEVRVPFLDHDLVDYVARIPGTVKMPNGRRKWLLKKALEGIVPDEVLHGAKSGFNVPFSTWLRSALKPMFFDHLARFERERPGVLDGAHVRSLYADTESERQDHSYRLWKLLNFMVWCDHSRVTITA